MAININKLPWPMAITHNITDKPFWKNDCGHDEKDYLYSCVTREIVHGKIEEEKLDVYLFEGAVTEVGICMRFGDEGSHYYSGNSIEDIFRYKSQMTRYEILYDVLNVLGKFKWVPNKGVLKQ